MRWITRSFASFSRSLRRLFRNVIVNPVIQFLILVSPARLSNRLSRQLSSTITGAAQAVTGGETATRPGRRWMHLLVGLPAVVVAVAGIGVTARAISKQRNLGQAYWRRGITAIQSGDFAAAQLYLTRASGAEGVAKREVDFALAVTFENLGLAGRSMEIFQRLAPTDRVGFAKAHQHLAIMIGRQGSDSPGQYTRDPETLARWLWHLTHASNQELPEVQETWGNYYLAVDDLKSAIQAYGRAASKYPQLYLRVANLQGRLGQYDLRRQTLERSRERYAAQLIENPGDRDSRIIYATTLMALGELEDAKRVLETGKRMDPDGPYDALLAAMYVQLHDQLRQRDEAASTARAIAQLRKALEIDPNFSPALSRLLSYAKVEPSAIEELRALLHEVLATGEGTSLAHLALSNLAWLEKNPSQAAFHLEQAIRLDGSMSVIANNLAWVLAHDVESPDLERALKLSNASLVNSPEHPRFLDTRGTILFKMNRIQEGLADLEKALPGLKDQAKICRKIAAGYRRLDMEEAALSYERRAATAAPR